MSGPPRTGRSRRTSNPQKWSEKASNALPDVRPFVSQKQNNSDVRLIDQSNGLTRVTYQYSLISGLALGSFEREVCMTNIIIII